MWNIIVRKSRPIKLEFRIIRITITIRIRSRMYSVREKLKLEIIVEIARWGKLILLTIVKWA